MQLRSDKIVRIATAFEPTDLAMTRACLEAHGIFVAAAPVHTLNTLPHYASALHGASIFVPEHQADGARELLMDLDWEKNWSSQRSQVKRVAVCVIFYLLAGFYAAPPMSGRILHRTVMTDTNASLTRNSQK